MSPSVSRVRGLAAVDPPDSFPVDVLQRTGHDELLARHVPHLRLDQRELFRPAEVDAYVEASELVDASGTISGAGRLMLDELDDRVGPDAFLQFITDEDRRLVRGEDLRLTARRILRGRLSRVGLFGRLLDAMFRLSLALRPTVPKRTTTAAVVKAEQLGMHDTPVCYARVVEAGEWVVLHYAYFYVMNDWRSSYRGLNDHEADWEQAWVFCDPADLSPVWVAVTSHDYHGADLRRHVADPELTMVDGHPVLYAAAGSHALFFRPGDYVTRIDIPGLRWVQRVRNAVVRLWLRDDADDPGSGPTFGVPFVDSAPGDGVGLTEWDIRPLEGRWVESFRGLWGLDTGDPLQGERGPSGPKFDREGGIRASWADPLGFADLHGSLPPSAADAAVNIEKIDRALEDLDHQIDRRRRMLSLLDRSRSPHDRRADSDSLTELLRERAELGGLRDRFLDGSMGDVGVRDHLRHPATPVDEFRAGWLRSGWASISIPLLLASIAAVVLLDAVTLASTAAIVAIAIVTVELLVHGRVRAFALLALGAVLVVAASIWVFGPVVGAISGWTVVRWVFGGALLLASLGLLLTNWREIRHNARR